MIKAIETRYKSCRFRSRLEARWAVFFDVLRIQWEYEVEGFELPSGRYLPDFWLPQVELWCEVKPKAFSSDELTKCVQLAHGHSGVLLLDGQPDRREYLCIRGTEYNHGSWDIEFQSFDIQDDHGYHVSESRFFHSACEWLCTNCCNYDDAPTLTAVEVAAIYESLGVRDWITGNERAVSVARSSRFEHGETPQVPGNLTEIIRRS